MPEVIAKAKICLLDFLSCAFEARNHPWSRQAIGIARGIEDGATIIGTSKRATPGDAAFANATLGHGLVREDMHAASICHHGVVIWPTLLALSERTPLSGATLLAAAIVGYEAGAQIGRALFNADLARLFRPTGLVGAARRRAGRKPSRLVSPKMPRYQRRCHRRQHLVRPERMAACRRLRDVFPSGFCGPQRRSRRSNSRKPAPTPRKRSWKARPDCSPPTADSPRPPPSSCSPATAGDHGRLQQAGSGLQFRADRRAGRIAGGARTRDIRGHRGRFDTRPRSRRSLSRLRFQGALSQCAAGQDEHPLQRRRRARAWRDRRGQLCADRSIRRSFASSIAPICSATPPSPRPSRRSKAPRSRSACAMERPSATASTMSSRPRRRKSAPAFGRRLPASSATTRARHLEELVDACESLRTVGVIAAQCRLEPTERQLRSAS